MIFRNTAKGGWVVWPVLALATLLAPDLHAQAPAGDPSPESAPEEAFPAAESSGPTEDEPYFEEIEPGAVQWVDAPGEPTIPGDWIDQPADDAQTHSPQYALERFVIQGNKKTLRQVILRHMELEVGQVFSAGDPRLEKARYRLLASGLFYNVQLSLKRGSKRGWAVLLITVKERNTIVVQDFVIGFSEISPYGSLDVAERSFLGSGINLSAAAVFSKKQYGYRLRLGDNHFLNSDFGLHIEGLYAHARDFFGNDKVCTTSTLCRDGQYDSFAVMRYDRAGLQLRTGYTLAGDNYFSLAYRFEVVNASVPPAGSHVSFGERKPIVFGHLLPGHSLISSLILGVVRDTRDSVILPSEGTRTALEVELSTEILGSHYNFSKFTLTHDMHFPLAPSHSIKVGLLLGLIMGDAPFFSQYFVGDFSAFVPSRVLEMNFSHLQPNLLETSIEEMRYEDLAANIGLEYSFTFFRGEKFLYSVNGFIGAGLFALASRDSLRTDPKGYRGHQVVPMDLTMDIGVRVDTEVGLFVLSLANLFRLIPSIGHEAAEK